MNQVAPQLERTTFGERQCCSVRQIEGLENSYVTSGPQNLF